MLPKGNHADTRDLCPYCAALTRQQKLPGGLYRCQTCLREFTDYERRMLLRPPCCP